jgi:multicopper oxidase
MSLVMLGSMRMAAQVVNAPDIASPPLLSNPPEVRSQNPASSELKRRVELAPKAFGVSTEAPERIFTVNGAVRPGIAFFPGEHQFWRIVHVPVEGNIDVVMDFTDPIIRGVSLFHCHLLSHEDEGMMAKFLLKREI